MKLALHRAVAKGVVVQVKGTGASGSFKLPAQKPTAAKPKAAKKAPKTKTAAPKKKAGKRTAHRTTVTTYSV